MVTVVHCPSANRLLRLFLSRRWRTRNKGAEVIGSEPSRGFPFNTSATVQPSH